MWINQGVLVVNEVKDILYFTGILCSDEVGLGIVATPEMANRFVCAKCKKRRGLIFYIYG
jgi:adenosyl cobinamide kinase/adenosyl cobinamide phosphate guanylyltransferase